MFGKWRLSWAIGLEGLQFEYNVCLKYAVTYPTSYVIEFYVFGFSYIIAVLGQKREEGRILFSFSLI